ALAAFVPGAAASPGARRDADQLRAKLPVAYRARLLERLAALPSIPDADAYLAACRRAADRAGLLACGDLTVAVDCAGGLEAASHLVRFAATREYLTIRRALRFRDHEDRTAPFARSRVT
nr:hypothetical protein [Deltaproteobacteria bacterium]